MSSDKSSSNKRKAAVVKEEPVTVDAEQEIWLVKKTVHQQALLNSSSTDKRTEQGSSLTGVKEEGSSSLAPSQPAATAGAIAPVPTPNVPGPVQHGGNNLSLVVKNIMLHCAVALGTGDIMAVNTALHCMLSVASSAAACDPALQRVVFVFAEALARHAMRSLPGLAWALQLQSPQLLATPATTHAARDQSFIVLCPLVRVAATAVNHAILEAMGAEHHVHIVDLGGANPNQWSQLLRLFAARPGGPPFLRFTIVNAQVEFLSRAAGLVTKEAVRLHVPFVVNPVQGHIDGLSPTSIAALGVVHSQGEALVITSTRQLHRLIADEVTIEVPAPAHGTNLEQAASHKITKADALLRVFGDLMPKLMVLTEQESDHNEAALSDRVWNAFDYYEVMFHDLEVGGAGPRLLLRDEVMDIIACDGALRRERHEKMARWALRMQMAGFEPAHVSDYAFYETAKLAHQLSVHCKKWIFRAQKVDKGCIFLYSRNVPIFSVSAWQPVQKTE